LNNDLSKTTRSETETEEFGAAFAEYLKLGDMVALFGELGAGKTAFTRGLCRGLGCQIEAHSPTFNIINIYPGYIEVAHMDLYRIDGDVRDLGWDDIIDQSRVVVVEWPEKAKNDLPRKRFDVFFNVIDADTREIKIVGVDDTGN
jgi:tRNA threonylcarbamoyladenosine biosynthesis protein TsaE